MYFSANCICREDVRVLVIFPALGFLVVAFKNAVNVGVPKLARLIRLNISHRNSILWLSVTVKSFNTARSAVITLGPCNVFRPRLPRNPAGCNSKALTSNHSLGLPILGLLDRPEA